MDKLEMNGEVKSLPRVESRSNEPLVAGVSCSDIENIPLLASALSYFLCVLNANMLHETSHMVIQFKAALEMLYDGAT
jgi:hypothetical protein